MLITTDEVIALGPINQDADPRQLLQSIQIAEDRFVRPAICAGLYEDFRRQKNVIVTDVNIDDLTAKVNAGNYSEPITLSVGQMVNAIELVETPAYTELWNEYLWKVCAEAVVFIASPTNFSRFTAQGEMQNNPKSITGEGQGAASVELKDIKWKMDKLMMERIDPLIEAMHLWLCENKGNFPTYTCKGCTRQTDGISIQRKSAWIPGLYDRKRNCEHENDWN
ncbi:hypothetical protein DXN05_03350 [Deminuibacter soli]|uniref:Uncharacterized protein n=1 Tax=Deminuibacter soli TaxID=2291815 RepID=A0A3E1NQ14_9BACT|nr:hypothetical protein DXN05_03350 [Deminuibacter soli]